MPTGIHTVLSAAKCSRSSMCRFALAGLALGLVLLFNNSIPPLERALGTSHSDLARFVLLFVLSAYAVYGLGMALITNLRGLWPKHAREASGLVLAIASGGATAFWGWSFQWWFLGLALAVLSLSIYNARQNPEIEIFHRGLKGLTLAYFEDFTRWRGQASHFRVDFWRLKRCWSVFLVGVVALAGIRFEGELFRAHNVWYDGFTRSELQSEHVREIFQVVKERGQDLVLERTGIRIERPDSVEALTGLVKDLVSVQSQEGVTLESVQGFLRLRERSHHTAVSLLQKKWELSEIRLAFVELLYRGDTTLAHGELFFRSLLENSQEKCPKACVQ